MNTKELVSRFNLSEKIDYIDLSNKLRSYLGSDEPNKISTLFQLISTVSELNWELYQYREILSQKSYSELYSSVISAYALNKKLGKVPVELTQLDIKLRSECDTDKIEGIVNSALVPLILNLIHDFNIDIQLLKLLNVIVTLRDICMKYHKKVKLTVEINKFNKVKNKYRAEITYFGFTSMFTESDLNAKYREFAKKLHPDHGGSQEEFMKMREYYENLLTLFR